MSFELPHKIYVHTFVHIHKYFGGRRVAAAVVSENNDGAALPNNFQNST